MALTVDCLGNKTWTKNGSRHRLDGPAVEYANGSWMWMQHGLCHRLDGPAVRYVNGEEFWFIEGVDHTEEHVKFLAFVNGISYNPDR